MIMSGKFTYVEITFLIMSNVNFEAPTYWHAAVKG